MCVMDFVDFVFDSEYCYYILAGTGIKSDSLSSLGDDAFHAEVILGPPTHPALVVSNYETCVSEEEEEEFSEADGHW